MKAVFEVYMAKLEQETPTSQEEQESEDAFLAFDGKWEFNGTKAKYRGPLKGQDGYCLARRHCRSADISVEAVVHNQAAAARVVFGYEATTGSFYSVGINGWLRAYVLARHTMTGVTPLRFEGGHSDVLTAGKKLINVAVRAQSVSLSVNCVPVLTHMFPYATPEGSVGLYVWGTDEDMVTFDQLFVRPKPKSAFVVMKFKDPYHDLYEKVIRPVAKEVEYDARPSYKIYGPGAVLQDIQREIVASDVVIVDISPTEENENVFYELGYAHAMQKPTILLANKDRKLPFDISGFRVVFYSDTIGGKSAIEDDLRKHLKAIGSGDSD